MLSQCFYQRPTGSIALAHDVMMHGKETGDQLKLHFAMEIVGTALLKHFQNGDIAQYATLLSDCIMPGYQHAINCVYVLVREYLWDRLLVVQIKLEITNVASLASRASLALNRGLRVQLFRMRCRRKVDTFPSRHHRSRHAISEHVDRGSAHVHEGVRSQQQRDAGMRQVERGQSPSQDHQRRARHAGYALAGQHQRQHH